MSVQIYKLIFMHKDWRHNKCAYIPCKDRDSAESRARDLLAEFGASSYAVEYQKTVDVM